MWRLTTGDSVEQTVDLVNSFIKFAIYIQIIITVVIFQLVGNGMNGLAPYKQYIPDRYCYSPSNISQQYSQAGSVASYGRVRTHEETPI